MILMLRASYLSGRLVEVLVKKQDETFVWMKGGRDRIEGGYVRYFRHDQREEAKEWIVQKHNRLGTIGNITKEQVYEIRDDQVSNEERKTGQLRRNEKGKVR